MIRVKCKSLFKGNASVGSHIVDACRKNNEDIEIEHKGKIMTVRSFMFHKFFV